jgi:hypothetical protein
MEDMMNILSVGVRQISDTPCQWTPEISTRYLMNGRCSGLIAASMTL